MLCQIINFTSDGRLNMRTYIHAEQAEEKRSAIIVLPGGAHGCLSDEEGEPVALTFFEKGFNTLC